MDALVQTPYTGFYCSCRLNIFIKQDCFRIFYCIFLDNVGKLPAIDDDDIRLLFDEGLHGATIAVFTGALAVFANQPEVAVVFPVVLRYNKISEEKPE